MGRRIVEKVQSSGSRRWRGTGASILNEADASSCIQSEPPLACHSPLCLTKTSALFNVVFSVVLLAISNIWVFRCSFLSGLSLM